MSDLRPLENLLRLCWLCTDLWVAASPGDAPAQHRLEYLQNEAFSTRKHRCALLRCCSSVIEIGAGRSSIVLFRHRSGTNFFLRDLRINWITAHLLCKVVFILRAQRSFSCTPRPSRGASACIEPLLAAPAFVDIVVMGGQTSVSCSFELDACRRHDRFKTQELPLP